MLLGTLDDSMDANMGIEMITGSVRSDVSLNDQGETGKLQENFS
jgi:hypothetical protein